MAIQADRSNFPTFYTSICKAPAKAMPCRSYVVMIAFVVISTASASTAFTAGSLAAEAKTKQACDTGTNNTSRVASRSTDAMQASVLLQAKTSHSRLKLGRGDDIDLSEAGVEDVQRALDNSAPVEENGDHGESLERRTRVEIELVQTVLLKSSSLHRIATHVKKSSVGSFLLAAALIFILFCAAACFTTLLYDPITFFANQRDPSLMDKSPSPLQTSKKSPVTRVVSMPPPRAWQNTWQTPPVSQSNSLVPPSPPNQEVVTPSSSSFGPQHGATNPIAPKQERHSDVQRDVPRREAVQRDENYLCVKLVVPSKSECLLIIPSQPARRSMFDITDQSGNVVLQVVLRGPSAPLSAFGTSAGLAGSLEASGVKRIALTSIDGEVLAQVCQVRKSPIPGVHGVAEFQLLRGTGNYFGTLAQAADGNCFELTSPAGKDLRFQADTERGGFEQYSVKVHMKDARAKLVATTERCQVSFDDGNLGYSLCLGQYAAAGYLGGRFSWGWSKLARLSGPWASCSLPGPLVLAAGYLGNRGYYRLRLGQYADVGAVLCGLLAVYHLAD